ncbi:MAG: 3-deoxy-7-phosphoheptulonate synthase [Spirochaetes bacterium]|nr:3-deoxy-7-phosphoheptulonate synthase [Spirochaetota bacterium]
MIIVLKPQTSQEEVDHIMKKIERLGLKPYYSKGEQASIIGVIGDDSKLLDHPIEAIAGVERVMPVLKPYKMASREFKAGRTIISVGTESIGDTKFTVIAGPCTVENEESMIRIAKGLKERGATFLRGGAFKPRTSPYAFQGLGKRGLEILAEARRVTGLGICTEVMDVRDVELVEQYADIIQIGARNTQNFNLLKEVGAAKKPVLLKRGFATTIEELLMSAEYILSNGNQDVILCERGIRTFETATRNTLDINAIPVLKELTHLPVFTDPSHATGKRSYVAATSYASLAAGADGVILEAHYDPESAVTDGVQTVSLETFSEIMATLGRIAPAVGRTV